MKINEVIHIDEVGDHYDQEPQDGYMPDEYHGRDVIWMGYDGRMVKVVPQISEPIWGNIFHGEKIEDTAQAIQDSEDKVRLNAPVGRLSIIDITDVKENIEGKMHGDLMFDPVIDDYHTYTTGDDDLDKYIVDPEEYLDDNSWEDEDRAELHKEMEETLQQAIEEEWGDIGNLSVQIRDGNHRRAAAFMAGEPFIWVLVQDDGYDERTEHYLQ